MSLSEELLPCVRHRGCDEEMLPTHYFTPKTNEARLRGWYCPTCKAFAKAVGRERLIGIKVNRR